jgi:heme-degrading monooxygenase HmoA
MIIQVIRFETSLSFDEVLEIAYERAPRFRELPGLVQKYYVRDADGAVAGIYVWDSEQSLHAYRASDLAASIPEAYQVSGPPDIQTYEVAFRLREE